MRLHFVDLHPPTPKGRARHFVNKKTGQVGTYTPDKTSQAEEYLRQAWRDGRAVKLEGPLSLKVVFYMPAPKALPKKRYAGPHIKRPDLDNLIKTVKDALRGLAYDDDSQIWLIDARKVYVGGERTREMPLTDVWLVAESEGSGK